MELTKQWAAELDDYVIDMAWSPDGALLAAASAAGTVRIFSAAGDRTHELPGHEIGTNCLVWVSARSLATGGQDGKVKFWDAESGQHGATSALGAAWVEHLAWNGRTLAAACGRRLVAIDPDGSVGRSAPDAAKTLSALAWRAGDALLAAAHFGGVRLISPGDFSVRKEYVYGNGIHALVWSPDGKWLVSGNQDPSVHLWIPDQDAEFQMSGYEGKVKHLSFDPSSRWLATGGGRDACVWDCSGSGPEGREPAMLPHDGPICALSFQNAHGLLATASQDGAVNLWSPERRQPLRGSAKLPAAAVRIAWSPEDRMLALGTEKGLIYVLNCK